MRQCDMLVKVLVLVLETNQVQVKLQVMEIYEVPWGQSPT